MQILKFKNYSLFIIVLTIVGLCFTSCESDLDLSDIDVDRSIVVNSIFSNEGEFLLNLTFSRSVLDSHKKFTSISDAEVILTDSGTGLKYNLTFESQGNYLLEDFIPVAGRKYNLEVTLKSGKKVFANTTLPMMAKVESVKSGFVNIADDNVFKVDFDIIDDDQTENYYIWDIITSGSEVDPFTIGRDETYRDFLFNYNGNSDPVSNAYTGQSKIYANDQSASNGVLNTSLVTFQNFIQEIEIDTSDTNTQINGNPSTIDSLPNGLTVTLRVLTVSKELYDYYRSVELYYQSGANNSSISSPTEIYSNVSCGHGIFAGYSETHIPLN